MTWNLILKFFSSQVLVVQTLYMMNPTDATLASLSVLKNSRWRPRWPSVMLLTPIWPTGSIKRALFLTFYGCLEAKWYRQLKWNIDSIQKVEILKMASKIAVIESPKTYLTKKRHKKHFNVDFVWLFRVEMIQNLIKMEHCLIQKVALFTMVSKMAAILKQNPTWNQNHN